LAGAVVSFSGFMAMQGALADPAYYDLTRLPPTPAAGEVERPLHVTGHRLDFWFYLGVCDARTRVFRWLTSFGLKDGSSSHTARVEEVRLVGHPGLLDELPARYQEWQALGAPKMRRWRLRFVPSSLATPSGTDAPGSDQPPNGPAGEARRAWTLEGTYYRRTFTLPPPDRANATMASNGGE
jgi:hypothetical protein